MSLVVEGSEGSPPIRPERWSVVVAGRWMNLVEAVAVGSLVVAMAVGMVLALVDGWVPVGDDSFIELLVRDVPSELPLTGVYSRYGWSHPGPTLFYLLAIPYRLFGSASSGLLFGAMLGHLLAAVAMWWVARRIDRLTGMLVLCGASLVLATTDAEVLRSPWNPYVGLVGSGLLVVLAWSAASRLPAGLIWLLPLGTLLVQSHVVTAPLVVATTAVAAVVALAPRSGADLPAWDAVGARPVALGLGITALLWLPPVIQQLVQEPGNLTELLLQRGTGSPIGLGTASATMSQAFGALPSVLDPGKLADEFIPMAATAPWWLLVPLVGAAVAVRRRDRPHLRGLVVVSGALVGCLLGIAAISDLLYHYLVTWNRGVVVVALAIGFGSMLGTAASGVRTGALVVAAAVTVTVNIVIGLQQTQAENPLSTYAPTVDALARAVEASELDGRTLSVDPVPDIQAAEVAGALMLQLERDGYEVTSRDFSAARIGRHRSERGPDELLVVAPISEARRLTDDGWTVLGAYQPLDRREATRAEELLEARRQLGDPRTEDERVEHFLRWTELTEEYELLTRGRVPMLVARRPA